MEVNHAQRLCGMLGTWLQHEPDATLSVDSSYLVTEAGVRNPRSADVSCVTLIITRRDTSESWQEHSFKRL